jgi:hypothetical protein
MTASLILALCLTAAPPQVFKSSDGNTWRITRTAGASPRPSYEQWYLHVERVGPDGGTLEVINFEETAWIEASPKITRSTRVEFALDEKGVFQATQTNTVKTEKDKPEVTLVVFKWNGTKMSPVRR